LGAACGVEFEVHKSYIVKTIDSGKENYNETLEAYKRDEEEDGEDE
jgi:hypothetical protein